MNLEKCNQLYQENDYISALISYENYRKEHPELASILNINKNIDLCLSKLYIKELTQPKISVIIPTHNVEKFIRRCLISVQLQSLDDIEVILVDDGSSDNTVKIIKEEFLLDPRFILISNSQASGNSGCPRNQGLHYANGEYICFVDSDDYIDKNMLRDLYSKAKSEDADICTSNGFYRESEGSLSEKIIFPDIKYDKSNYEDIFRLPQFPIIWYRIYRTSFLRNNKIKLGEFKVSADVIFSLKTLLLADKIVKVDGVYYHYNFNRPGSTIERRRGEQVLDLFKSYEAIMHFIKVNPFKNCYSLVVNKFIGDYFYCKKNMLDTVKIIFDDFSRSFIKKYLPLVEDRKIISEFSNKILDDLYNDKVNEPQKYIDFITGKIENVEISVIVPAHNIENYIKKCLDSIAIQKFKSIEIIVVDDASEDSTGEIIDKFSQIDSRLKKITISSASGNPGTVRNIGLEVARGSYITFVDGDDWIDSEYFSRLKASVVDKTDIVYSRAFIREEVNNSRIFNFNVPKLQNLDNNSRIGLINSSFFSNIWGRLYKREFLIKHSIIFPKMYVSEDLTFSLVCAFFAQSISVADTQGYHYRYNRPNSTTHQRTGIVALRQIFSYNEFIDTLAIYDIKDKLLASALVKKINSFIYTYDRISQDNLREFFKIKLIDILRNYPLVRDDFLVENDYLTYMKFIGK